MVASEDWRSHEVNLLKTNPGLARQVQDVRRRLQYSAWWWRNEVNTAASVDGSAEAVDTEVAARLSHLSSWDSTAAGQFLGVSSRRVLQLIDEGTLRANRVGRSWAIDIQSAEEYLMRREA